MLHESPIQFEKHGLIPTPLLPVELGEMELSENARHVLIRRYVRHGSDGEPVETGEEMLWRVAYHVARVEEEWNGAVMDRAREYYELLSTKCFFPNSPTFTGAGTPLGQLAASTEQQRRDLTQERGKVKKNGFWKAIKRKISSGNDRK